MSERLSQEQVLMHAMTLCHENVGEETAHRMASELLLARAVVEAVAAHRAALTVAVTAGHVDAPMDWTAADAADDALTAALRAYDEGARDA